MIRITINHTNKYGPLEFPARGTQIFIEDSKVPQQDCLAFYDKCVESWFGEHPDRQLFSFQKDIVDKRAMPNGSKIYGASEEAKAAPSVVEEEI